MQLQINLSAIETLKNTELPDLLTVRQVGEILGISRVSVCKQISSENSSRCKKEAFITFLKVL